jgi:protoporphyrinogen oxidase
MGNKTAIIIGAGPAGLTAAYELLEKTDIRPVIFEKSGDIGGISKTVNYRGNRIDIGGHRFFSKSDRVMQWWQDIMPIQGAPARDDLILGRDIPVSHAPGAPDPEKTDRVFLIRNRLSRIFFMRRFFDYPISLNRGTLANLGAVKIARIAQSYLRARLFPIRDEKSLEDFFINRFGRELYLTFFKDYTEKVWGVPCSVIKAEWGAQRIKGLSITSAVHHALKKMTSRGSGIAQKDVETSLIEQFLYPKYGPGQMWEEVAKLVVEKGGEIHRNCDVTKLFCRDETVTGVEVRNSLTGERNRHDGDYFFSTMPVVDLVRALDAEIPADVRETADGLMYRDFITVGLLLKRLKIANTTSFKTINNIVPDNWIYIQERDVKIGRLQVFNNWSPYLVKDQDKVWLGLEYFCNEGDALWTKPDDAFIAFAVDELAKIDIIEKDAVVDGVVIRVEKAYPAYFGSYDRFDRVRAFTDRFANLFLLGRNGMHRYNNMDHSMLTAMVAVENIMNGVTAKENIWSVNTEEEYHERK